MSLAVGEAPEETSEPAPAAALEPASGDGARFGGINALRALAAFAVLAFHVLLVSPLADGPVSFFVHQLGFGVSLFFVISGFLLFRPFARALDRGERVDISAYARSRVLRILPLYLLVAAVIVAVDSSRRSLDLIIRSLTFSGVYNSARVPEVVHPVAWSLDDEVIFYAFLPLLFLLVLGLVKAGWRFRSVAITVAVLGLASVAYRATLMTFLASDPRGPEGDPVLLRIFPAKLDLFALGMLLAMVALRFRRKLPGVQVAGLLVVAGILVAIGDAAYFSVKSLADVLMGAGFAALLAAVVFSSPASGFSAVLTSAPLRFLGEISYGVYLWHSVILRQMNQHGLTHHGYLYTLVAATIATTALATATYYLVERPFLRRKPLWVRASRQPAAAVAG